MWDVDQTSQLLATKRLDLLDCPGDVSSTRINCSSTDSSRIFSCAPNRRSSSRNHFLRHQSIFLWSPLSPLLVGIVILGYATKFAVVHSEHMTKKTYKVFVESFVQYRVSNLILSWSLYFLVCLSPCDSFDFPKTSNVIKNPQSVLPLLSCFVFRKLYKR